MPGTVEGDLVYFLHIPKTSGTSLHRSFLGVCGPETASPQLIWDDLVNGTYQLSERIRLITGHFGGFLSLWLKRWPRIVTMLRDPMARALSHINHVQREPSHPLHALAVGLSVAEYCEHPVLRKTVDNFQSRYLASLEFALTLMPRPTGHPGHQPYGSISVGFENALHSLDKETGLLEGAVRALDAIDAVGICEAHAASLQVLARAMDWDAEIVEFGLNHARGQRTLEDLSRTERDALTRLNLIDVQVYARAIEKFLRLCGQYGIELSESERSALARRGTLDGATREQSLDGATRRGKWAIGGRSRLLQRSRSFRAL